MTRSGQRADVRSRLLEAGRTVFAASGFAGTSVGDVAAAAGINRATFYAHFDSKTELVNAVCARVVASADDDWERLDSVLADGSVERLRAWLGSAAGWWERNADVLPALREAGVVDRATGRLLGSAFTGLADHLHQAVEGYDEDRRRRAVLMVQLLVVQLDQVLFDHIVLGLRATDLPDLLDLLAEVWCAVVSSW